MAKTDDGILHLALEKLKDGPQDINSLYLIGNIFYKKNDYQKSFEYYSELIAGPNIQNYLGTKQRFQAYLELGIAAYYIKKSDEAIISLKKARSCIPGSFNLRLAETLGRLLFQKGQYSEAASELENAYKLKKEDSRNNFCLGVCYVKLNRCKEALPLLEPLQSQYGDNPQFLLALADGYAQMGQKERAVKYYLEVLDDLELGALASKNLGLLYWSNGNDREALSYLNRVLELENPMGELSYRALYESAKIYAKLGKLYEACELLEQLASLKPGYLDAAVLLENYREMAKNNNLYLLYHGSQNQRKHVLRRLLHKLLPGILQIHSETYQLHLVEAVVRFVNKYGEQNYYVWLSLRSELIRLKQVRELIEHGNTAGCSSYILISANVFDAKVKSFCEMRPIDLIEGPELNKKLLEI